MKNTTVTKATSSQTLPPGPDPAEGSREVIEAELRRRQGKDQAAGSAKKAQNKRKIDKSH